MSTAGQTAGGAGAAAAPGAGSGRVEAGGRLAFSVLIPTRNRPDMITNCLRALQAQAHPAFEVLILDQSPGDGTREAVAAAAGGDPRVRHVPVTGVGRSRGLNAGIPLARHPWLIMTDDDCEAAPDWLASMEEEALRGGPRAAIVGRVAAGPVGPGMAPPPSTLEDPDPVDHAGRLPYDPIYPNLALPRAAFDEVGLFDERMSVGTSLPGGEDNDLGYRLLKAGWRILYRPGPTVIHRAWRDTASRAALKRDYGLGQGAFYAKHMAALDPYIAYRFARDVLGTCRAAGGAVLRGWPQEARNQMAFLGGLLGGAARMTLLALKGVPAQGRT